MHPNMFYAVLGAVIALAVPAAVAGFPQNAPLGRVPALADTVEVRASVIDYPLPAWAKSYTAAMEGALGSAYAEPAADVRGYIAYVRSQKQ